MVQLKSLLILSFAIFTVFTSCEKDEENDNIEPSDYLDQFGILGKWGLQSITINGITDMIVHYDSIEFTTGIDGDDLKGEFISSDGVGYETNGQFELETANNIIHFNFNNSQKSYEFDISDSLMIFTYSEENNEIIEYWRKKE
ncbi:hypothetical protein [Salinivirga cyanobacteriivorans]